MLLQEKDVDLLLVDSGDLHDGTWKRTHLRYNPIHVFQELVFPMAILLVVSMHTRFVLFMLHTSRTDILPAFVYSQTSSLSVFPTMLCPSESASNSLLMLPSSELIILFT